MKTVGKKTLLGLTLPIFGLASQDKRNLFSFKSIKAECQSNAEKEAEELEKILQSQNGNMPVDPEEMQMMLMEARNKGKKPKPTQFMHFMMPLKTFSSFRTNDGFHFGFGVPLAPRYQINMNWMFSNKKLSVFELTNVLIFGDPNPMKQDEMSMIQLIASTPQQTG